MSDFDANQTYGIQGYDDDLVAEFAARAELPKGTPFKILADKRSETLAWYYSPDGHIPNPERVRVVRVCVA